MPFSQPTRRNVVKGAAWSVPVVVAGSAAPALAASPCNIVVHAECVDGDLVFSYSITGPIPAGPLSFSFTYSASVKRRRATGVSPRGLDELRVSDPAAAGGLVTCSYFADEATVTVAVMDSPCAIATSASGTLTENGCSVT